MSRPGSKTEKTDELTTTSYAVLGLLSLQEWSTYELAQQMQRSMRLWWPRAESRVYEEPKRLVRLGLADRRRERTGKRPRTVYAITDEGRAVLREWLAEPPAPFRMEFEGMLKVFFADQAAKRDALGAIDAIREAALAEVVSGVDFLEAYSRRGGPFPERLHIISLATDFYERLLETMVAWADDAEADVRRWRSTTRAPDPVPALRERLARAEQLARRARMAE